MSWSQAFPSSPDKPPRLALAACQPSPSFQEISAPWIEKERTESQVHGLKPSMFEEMGWKQEPRTLFSTMRVKKHFAIFVIPSTSPSGATTVTTCLNDAGQALPTPSATHSCGCTAVVLCPACKLILFGTQLASFPQVDLGAPK